MERISHKKRITGNIKLRKIMMKPVCIILARDGEVWMIKSVHVYFLHQMDQNISLGKISTLMGAGLQVVEYYNNRKLMFNNKASQQDFLLF
jgi:hypothetical protein